MSARSETWNRASTPCERSDRMRDLHHESLLLTTERTTEQVACRPAFVPLPKRASSLLARCASSRRSLFSFPLSSRSHRPTPHGPSTSSFPGLPSNNAPPRSCPSRSECKRSIRQDASRHLRIGSGRSWLERGSRAMSFRRQIPTVENPERRSGAGCAAAGIGRD